MTGKTSAGVYIIMSSFFGNDMVPNSQARQTLLAMCVYETEQFTLNWRQGYDSTQAILPGKAHMGV